MMQRGKAWRYLTFKSLLILILTGPNLQALLPKEDDKTQHETLEQLFGGENFFFGNPVAQFQANLQGTKLTGVLQANYL